MKTFIVLIPIEGSVVEPRKACEMIENTNFKFNGSYQPSCMNIRDKVLFELGVEDNHSIEVESMTDFMDRCNDQELDLESYFISYVRG